VENEYKKVIVHIYGRIMLDTKMFLQQNEYTDLLKPPVHLELEASDVKEEDLIYCNHCIGGFGFRQKMWSLFAVNRFEPVVWDHNAFSKLVMDVVKRDLIHSLVKSHRNGTESFDDVVSGKGQTLGRSTERQPWRGQDPDRRSHRRSHQAPVVHALCR
jgi:hypothetical protein